MELAYLSVHIVGCKYHKLLMLSRAVVLRWCDTLCKVHSKFYRTSAFPSNHRRVVLWQYSSADPVNEEFGCNKFIGEHDDFLLHVGELDKIGDVGVLGTLAVCE